MRPKSIKKRSDQELAIVWDDGRETLARLEKLRDGCPCAACRGETILLHEYQPPPPDKEAPGRYRLTAVEPVGSYAVQLTWADGHGSGIYTWERLRELCE